MANPRKLPSDAQLREAFHLNHGITDRSNLKKFEAVNKILHDAAKAIREVFPGETGNISPILDDLIEVRHTAQNVVRRRAGQPTIASDGDVAAPAIPQPSVPLSPIEVPESVATGVGGEGEPQRQSEPTPSITEADLPVDLGGHL